MPGLTPPTLENGTVLVDGSTIMSLDITAAVESCREIVENDEDIVLDIIMIQESELCG